MTNIEEIWKPINEKYEVSNLGNVKSIDRIVSNSTNLLIKKLYKGKILNQYKNGPYPAVCVFSKKHSRVHRLVAEAFVENPENKLFVNHKNGIKTDNRALNLEWCTRSENAIHAFAIGLHNLKGEKHTQHKLNNIDIIIIREAYPTYSQASIARYYGVANSLICEIVNRRSWSHI